MEDARHFWKVLVINKVFQKPHISAQVTHVYMQDNCNHGTEGDISGGLIVLRAFDASRMKMRTMRKYIIMPLVNSDEIVTRSSARKRIVLLILTPISIIKMKPHTDRAGATRAFDDE